MNNAMKIPRSLKRRGAFAVGAAVLTTVVAGGVAAAAGTGDPTAPRPSVASTKGTAVALADCKGLSALPALPGKGAATGKALRVKAIRAPKSGAPAEAVELVKAKPAKVGQVTLSPKSVTADGKKVKAVAVKAVAGVASARAVEGPVTVAVGKPICVIVGQSDAKLATGAGLPVPADAVRAREGQARK